MKTATLQRAAAAASAAADAARAEILPRFRNVAVEIKGDGSPVTEADRRAEQAIREVLAGFDPALPILGEEFGGDAEAPDGWVVDPIDGTLSFSRGIPLFGTLIALLEDGAPVLGLIDLPALDDRTLGWRGGGVRRNGTAVRVSDATDPGKAIIAHGDPYAFALFGARASYEALARDLPMLRGYTDAFGHAQVLHGGVGAMVDVHLNPWDAATVQVLVPEAGGRCVTFDRREGGHGLGLVFGAAALVDALVPYLEAEVGAPG